MRPVRDGDLPPIIGGSVGSADPFANQPQLVKPVRFVVYGVPTDELKKTLADFHPIYMTPFDGFTK